MKIVTIHNFSTNRTSALISTFFDDQILFHFLRMIHSPIVCMSVESSLSPSDVQANISVKYFPKYVKMFFNFFADDDDESPVATKAYFLSLSMV
jgi:hypothetical protein